MGLKNKKWEFAQNRFLTVYTKLKSSSSRSRKPVSEGSERLEALKKIPKGPKKGGKSENQSGSNSIMGNTCLRPRVYDSTLRLRPGDKKRPEGAK